MMSHRTIWYVTGIVVLAAGVVVFVRGAGERATPPQEPKWILKGRQAGRLITAMLACVEKDPRVHREKTRLVVDATAALAESGALDTAETQYALGLRLFEERRDPRMAERAFRKAIELRPEWSWPHNSLGILLHEEGRIDEAEKAFREAIRLESEWSRPHNDLAILLRLTGRLDEAEKEALLALELDPNDVAAHNNYGNLLVEFGRYDEAERTYQKAISIEPDAAAPYFNLACLASLRGDRDSALSFLNCTIVLDADFRKEAMKDPDFIPLREDSEFRALVYGEKQ